MSDEPRTALGSAHERFVRSLPDRGRELVELARELQATPTDERLAEQVGRRMHALYASAQVFQDAPLLEAVKLALAGIDASGAERRPPTPGEIDAALALAEWLRTEARGDAAELITSLRAEAGSSDSRRPESRRAAFGGSRPARVNTPHDAQMAVAHTLTGVLPAPDVLAVLVVASRAVESQLRAVLPEDHCEITTSEDPETALSVIDQVAPDLVLIEATMLGSQAAALILELRGGRAAGVRAVVAIVSEGASDVEALLGRSHADGVLRLPLPSAGLFERLQRWAGRGAPGARHGLEALEAGTVDEIAREVAQEIQRGIAGSLRRGRGERIELGDKSDLLAATWSAVARVRASLSLRAEGRVHFDEAPFEGGPLSLALTDRDPAAPRPAPADALRGRRILIADDDPAVLWFFGNLLREAGAIAIEARDGKQALELARRKPPDVVVSDILMPHIDGFSLCRELQRDLSLSHVPVILLSWKEDFLQRMRELDAGAAGYLRKEAGSDQILATIANALRPRLELVALLSSGDELQGRVDPLGVPVLLATVARHRPDARITLRDAWNVFEVDIRGGNTLAVTRTASDGSFARGPLALRQLLGVESGRFTVTPAQGRARNAFAEPLDALIAQGLRELGAALDAVSDGRLLRVCRVTLDDALLSPLLTATPTALADVAARLRSGEAARDMVLSGWIAARDLEQHLREFVRRGAVLSVCGPDGEDLIAAAREARESDPGALLHTSDRPRPSSLPPVEVAESEVEWLDTARRVAASVPEPRTESESDSESDTGSESESDSESGAPRLAEMHPAVASAEPEPFAVRSSLLHRATPVPSRPSPPPADVPVRSRRAERALLVLALAALAVFGFAAMRSLWDGANSSKDESDATPPASGAVQPEPEAAPDHRDDSSSPAAEPTSPPAQPPNPGLPPGSADPTLGFGRVLPFIEPSHQVRVAANEGLLVVAHDRASAPPRVKVGGRDLGRAPVATALPEGRHEIMLERGERTSFRYVIVRRGETRIVELTGDAR